jgi:hypothetical protein
MKITKKILERIINEEVKKLIEQEGSMSGGYPQVGGGGNKATIEGLDESLRSIHLKLDELITRLASASRE